MINTGSLIVVERGEIIRGDILPRSQEDLLKKIVLSPGAYVEGSIVGGVVELHAGSRVTGGILASEIQINVKEIEEHAMRKIALQGDVISTSTISINVNTRARHDVLIHVMGNLIASRRIRISNALVEGNIVSSSVDLHNVVGLGILGLVRFDTKETELEHENLLSNSIFLSIISEKNIEILGHEDSLVGIYSPFIYISPTDAYMPPRQSVKKPQRIVALRVECLEKLLDEIKELSDKMIESNSNTEEKHKSINDLIVDKLKKDECRVYELLLEQIKGSAPLVLLETLPPIRKRRRERELETALPGLVYARV